MTCIAGWTENRKVVIGGDSAGIGGFDLCIRKDSKVFKNGPFLFGFTSSFRMGQLLRFSFVPPSQDEEQTVYGFMCTTFIDEIRKCLKDGGFSEIDNNQESGGQFLVAYKGRLFKIDGDFQVGESVDKFDACGSGESFAIGALNVLNESSKSPKEKVRIALETAHAYCIGVRPPFNFVEN